MIDVRGPGPILALLLGMAAPLQTSASVLPSRYGVAFELEDTGVADLTLNLENRRTAPGDVQPFELSFHFADIALAHGTISGRSAITDAYTSTFRFSPQLLAYTLPIGSSRLQLQAGYQPVRLRNIDDISTAVSIDMRNIDRLLVDVNGCTTLDPQRRLFYGAEFSHERQTGFTLRHTVINETEYELYEYHGYGDGDDGTAVNAGIGYWRDFWRGDRPIKVLCVLEGFYDRDRRALRVDDNLVEWLSSDHNRTSTYQYSLHSSGSVNKQRGGRLQVSLSDRYTPFHPAYYKSGDGHRLTFCTALDRFSHSFEFADIFYESREHRISDVLPYGQDTYSVSSQRFEPSVRAGHALSFYATLPPNKVLRSFLFGRSTWDARTVIWRQEERYQGYWNGALKLWLGASALLHSRILMELSYSVLSVETYAAYYSLEPTGKWHFDGYPQKFADGRWAFGLRLLGRPATPRINNSR